MAGIGIILGLIVVAVRIVLGVVRGLTGAALGLLGGTLGLLVHFFPVVLITIGIIWLVKGSSSKNVAKSK